MNKSASEPVEVSELNSFLEEIFSKFDNEDVAKDEYVFSKIWVEDCNFREAVEDFAIEIVEENETGNSTRQEQNTYFRKALVEYFEYRVLIMELLKINSNEDREDAARYIWGNELGEDTLNEAITNPLYIYQACEALYCIFKELLMEFFNEGHEKNYPQKRLGLLTAYYRVGIRSVIDKKNGKESNLSDLNEILKESSEREKKQFIENCSFLQTPPFVEDFRELCTNSN
ncbi:MAG: hypothetical protein HOB18_00805 [Nitrospina sp.]|jgi:hypothetical protein|nr:hypothetical protein [Nitrospina sp.]